MYLQRQAVTSTMSFSFQRNAEFGVAGDMDSMLLNRVKKMSV
jgi:hypothetical protein